MHDFGTARRTQAQACLTTSEHRFAVFQSLLVQRGGGYSSTRYQPLEEGSVDVASFLPHVRPQELQAELLAAIKERFGQMYHQTSLGLDLQQPRDAIQSQVEQLVHSLLGLSAASIRGVLVVVKAQFRIPEWAMGQRGLWTWRIVYTPPS